MIIYRYEEERTVALYFAERLGDVKARNILEAGEVSNRDEAIHLSRFFWKMVEKSVEDKKLNIPLPCDGGADYWTEKLYSSLGGYVERAGFEAEWNQEVDKA